jgi:hypothetical protein
MAAEAYQIRRMNPEDVAIAIEWARREGWNPGLHDAQTFYQADPNGFFIGELNGEASDMEGPYRLVLPGEKREVRSIRNLRTIRIINLQDLPIACPCPNAAEGGQD